MVLSPNYPHNYTAGQTCLYSVTVPKEFGENVLPFLIVVVIFLLLNFFWHLTNQYPSSWCHKIRRRKLGCITGGGWSSHPWHSGHWRIVRPRGPQCPPPLPGWCDVNPYAPSASVTQITGSGLPVLQPLRDSVLPRGRVGARLREGRGAPCAAWYAAGTHT